MTEVKCKDCNDIGLINMTNCCHCQISKHPTIKRYCYPCNSTGVIDNIGICYNCYNEGLEIKQE